MRVVAYNHSTTFRGRHLRAAPHSTVSQDPMPSTATGNELVPQKLLDEAARRFKMLSEPVRLQLLNQLNTHGEMTVQELVDATGQSQANVSKHLGQLARSGCLARRKDGLYVHYRIKDPTISAMCVLVCSQLKSEMRDD